MTRLAILFALASSACQTRDVCDRAAERIERILARPHSPYVRPDFADMVREECRREVGDPVAFCAMTAPTDDAANRCIEQLLSQTVTVDPAAPKGSGDGKGLNPLLDR